MTEDGTTRFALVGSYVPRLCGIATFGHDLVSALAGDAPSIAERPCIVAVTDREEGYEYGPEVTFEIRQHRQEDYRSAAEYLNTSKTDVVCVQHEYGIYGGEDGGYLVELLDQLTKPVVTTLHTVLKDPLPGQREVLRRICGLSALLVVMSQRAEELLCEVYDVPPDRVRLVHHGAPDLPFSDTGPFKERFGVAGRPTILTFGLLGPGKGIETMLTALSQIVPRFPDLAYIVLGVTHPVVRRQSGESYRLSLESQAVSLCIQNNVIFHKRYVSLEDLCEYLQAADLYVTPYTDKAQVVSGTLAYAMATGRAVVSTPYWYAQEMLAEGRGRLFDFDDSGALARHLEELLADPELRTSIRKRAYEYGRAMVWPQVGKRYREVFEEAKRIHAQRAVSVTDHKLIMRMSLPELRLDHLFVLTDDTGLLQHAKYAVPDREHGYTTDDNARALIVMTMMWSLFRDEKVLPFLQLYLSFLRHAWSPDAGQFRNFMSYERRWLDEGGGDDCQGRALWALGHLIAHAPNKSVRGFAEELFREALPHLERLSYPRGWALGILGLHYYGRKHAEDERASETLVLLARRLDRAVREHEAADWAWFEDIVTYDNGRIPQALLVGGHETGDEEMTARGLRVLRWLLDVQKVPAGHLSVIGCDGWLRREGARARFDQQSLEPAALIGACKAAYRSSGDAEWLVEMRRCFEWYLGRNDREQEVLDFQTRGCHDGLTPAGVNANQGAESLVSWLLSLLIMQEMQTGAPPGEHGKPVLAGISS
ncbi:MAG: glycosyltransferase family 4 protein [Deltaproteobacteria bacterium]|nr:glycosyltransferase family 4 protein [Deltaproteobacteria bacterium]